MITTPETRARLQDYVGGRSDLPSFLPAICADILADLDRLARIEGLAERIAADECEQVHGIMGPRTFGRCRVCHGSNHQHDDDCWLRDLLTLLRPPAPAPTERT